MKKIFTLFFSLIATIATMFATNTTDYLLDSIVRVDESTGFVDSKKIYEYHENGTISRRVNLRASWSSWKVGIPKILNSKTTWIFDKDGNETDYYTSQLDTVTGIWKDTHHYLYDERHNRVVGVRLWNEDSTIVLSGSHYYYDDNNFQTGNDQFETWNGVQVPNYKCINAKNEHGNKLYMVEFSKPDGAWEGDYMSDPEAFNASGWVRIDSVSYTYNDKQEKTKETIYRWDNDNQEWKEDGYQIFEYDEAGHCIADTVFARDFETNAITYNNMTTHAYDSHGQLSRLQMYNPKFTDDGVEWIENGMYAYDYSYDENENITQLRDYIDWQSGSSISYYISTYNYSLHAIEEPEPCIIASGTCGTNFTWELSCDSVLTLIGSGMIPELASGPAWDNYKNNIAYVSLPDELTGFGWQSFANCRNLKRVYIPSKVKSISNAAFEGCSSLTEINVAQDNETYSSIDGVLCNKDATKLLCFPAGKKGSYTIPSSIIDIGNSAFYNCSGLTEIIIPDGVKSIGNAAFEYCRGVVEIIVPNSVVYIDDFAFSQIPHIVYNGSASWTYQNKYWGARSLNGYVEGSLVYSDSSKNNIITCFPNATGEIEIPNSVYSIEKNAFYDCSKLSKIIIPSSVTIIKEGTFYGCSNLTNVSIPDAVTHIEEYAFKYCTKLKAVTIPNSIINIGSEAFGYCTNLSTIIIPSSVQSIGSYAFDHVPHIVYDGYISGSPWGARSMNGFTDGWLVYSDDSKTNLLSCLPEAEGEIVIPNSVTNIENSAFLRCASISSITLPEGITSIGENAFSGCIGLTKPVYNSHIFAYMPTGFIGDYSIPEGITTISSAAFSGCSKLTAITIPKSVTEIANNAFSYCYGLKSITWNAIDCSYSFSNINSQIESFTFGDDIKVIPGSLCYGMSKLTSIIIPNNITQIGSYAFSGCTGLTSVTIGENVESIGTNAFRDCSNLASVTLLSNTIIGTSYSSNNMLKTIFGSQVTHYTLGDKITSIGDYAFFQTNISKIKLPESVTEIGQSSFYQCQNLSSIEIPDNVLSIGRYAFSGCKNLDTVKLGEKLQIVNYQAFYDCDKITEITIPEKLTYLAENVFENCDNLRSIIWNAEYYYGSLGSWGGYPLENSNITSFTIGENVKIIPNNLCREMSITSISIPDSVRSIGNYAFCGCWGLGSIAISKNIEEIGEGAFSNCDNIHKVIWNAKKCQDFTSSPFAGPIIQTFEFGDEVEHIPAYLCQRMKNIKTITIPNSVKSIGEYAFDECSSLKSVHLPANVTTVGDYAFRNCSSLINPIYNEQIFACLPMSFTGVYTIPEGIKTIIGGACYGCYNLTSLTIPESVTKIGDYIFRNYAFQKFDSLDTLRILCKARALPSEKWDIAGNGGVEIPNLKYIEAPSVFFDVNEYGWPSCPKYLTDVIITEGELTDNIFSVVGRSYKTLQKLDVSATSNTSFADEAFKGYYNLKELALPSALENVSYMMVAGCKNLKSITIPASVVEIDQSAFEDCRSIKEIIFEEGSLLTKIGNWAFYNCHELEDIYIPEGVTEIGSAAFYGCAYAQEVHLPKSVQTIGDNGFALCSKIKKMRVDAVNPPVVENKTFYEVPNDAPVYVPDASVADYKAHPVWGKLNIIGNSESPTAINNTADIEKSTKILRDGQLLILHGDKTYTITGQEVR